MQLGEPQFLQHILFVIRREESVRSNMQDTGPAELLKGSLGRRRLGQYDSLGEEAFEGRGLPGCAFKGRELRIGRVLQPVSADPQPGAGERNDRWAAQGVEIRISDDHRSLPG